MISNKFINEFMNQIFFKEDEKNEDEFSQLYRQLHRIGMVRKVNSW